MGVAVVAHSSVPRFIKISQFLLKLLSIILLKLREYKNDI